MGTHQADRRSFRAHKRRRLKNEEIVSYVRSKLKEGWSPEQISGRLPIDCPGLSISHEAIYQFIYSFGWRRCKELSMYLRRKHWRRRKKTIERKCRRPKILNSISIEERPADIETRRQFGHWEGDTIVSNKSTGSLSCLVERKSRLLILTKVKRRTADVVANAIIKRLGAFPEHARRTLTLDNGGENAAHEKLTTSLNLKCFFAHPYAAWQRGTNENTNRLLRQYFPKGTELSGYSQSDSDKVALRLNQRPRKTLGYQSPAEKLKEIVALTG